MTWVASEMGVFADRTRAQVIADTDFGSASTAEKVQRAQLIAAAPDLLAALQSLLALHIAHHNAIEHAHARKVIARATGAA